MKLIKMGGDIEIDVFKLSAFQNHFFLFQCFSL